MMNLEIPTWNDTVDISVYKYTMHCPAVSHGPWLTFRGNMQALPLLQSFRGFEGFLLFGIP